MRLALAGLALVAAFAAGTATAEAHDRYADRYYYAPYPPPVRYVPPPRVYYPPPYYYAPAPVYVVPRPAPHGYYAPYRPYPRHSGAAATFTFRF